jgi:hypothetical protein
MEARAGGRDEEDKKSPGECLGRIRLLHNLYLPVV